MNVDSLAIAPYNVTELNRRRLQLIDPRQTLDKAYSQERITPVSSTWSQKDLPGFFSPYNTQQNDGHSRRVIVSYAEYTPVVGQPKAIPESERLTPLADFQHDVKATLGRPLIGLALTLEWALRTVHYALLSVVNLATLHGHQSMRCAGNALLYLVECLALAALTLKDTLLGALTLITRAGSELVHEVAIAAFFLIYGIVEIILLMASLLVTRADSAQVRNDSEVRHIGTTIPISDEDHPNSSGGDNAHVHSPLAHAGNQNSADSSRNLSF